jgi:putative MATE family efflux protein
VLVWPFLPDILRLLGASGDTLALATRFLQIVMPSTPIVSMGMGMTGILRGVGDARRAMYITLGAGLAAAVFDPLLIFGLGLGLDGAAISNVLSRLVLLGVGIYGAHFVHRLVVLPDWTRLTAAIRPFFGIGLPAVMTQIATPIGYAYITAEIARFGDEAVAGWTVAGRISPVAFGVIFALSGAVGPIIGQNFGARQFDRVRSTIRDSLTVTIIYVLAVWALLALFSGSLASLFGTTGLARELVIFFCVIAAGSFVFNGAIFVASAAFNNLGYPIYSTFFNWGRSTFGVVPFVWYGARHFGPEGVIAGWGIGAVIFGIASVLVCFRTLATIGGDPPAADDAVPAPPPAANSPFSTGKASTLQ